MFLNFYLVCPARVGRHILLGTRRTIRKGMLSYYFELLKIIVLAVAACDIICYLWIYQENREQCWVLSYSPF